MIGKRRNGAARRAGVGRWHLWNVSNAVWGASISVCSEFLVFQPTRLGPREIK